MRLIYAFFAIFAIGCHLSAVSPAYASGSCDQDCMKCHTLSTDEVLDILTKTKNPDVKILKIQMSPVRGLWEVDIEDKGQRGIFYVDFSKKYIVAGSIVEIETSVNKTRATLTALNTDRKINFSKIPLKEALVLGDKKAAKKVIVFTDPDCPFCGKLHSELKKVIEKRKDIAIYLKLFPLKMHQDSYWKSKSIMCSKSLKLLEDNFDKKPIPKQDCGIKEIDKNIELAKSLDITGTPTIILPDGSVYNGFIEADELIKKVDSSKKRGAS